MSTCQRQSERRRPWSPTSCCGCRRPKVQPSPAPAPTLGLSSPLDELCLGLRPAQLYVFGPCGLLQAGLASAGTNSQTPSPQFPYPCILTQCFTSQSPSPYSLSFGPPVPSPVVHQYCNPLPQSSRPPDPWAPVLPPSGPHIPRLLALTTRQTYSPWTLFVASHWGLLCPRGHL